MRKIKDVEAKGYKYANGEQLYNTKSNVIDSTHSALGLTTAGELYELVVSEAPNVLIGGPNSSGKTETIHTLLLSMMSHATPQELEIYIVSNNPNEYSEYKNSPHLKMGVISSEDEINHLIETLKSERSSRASKIGESLSNDSLDYNGYVNYDPERFIPQSIVVFDDFEDISKGVAAIEDEIIELASSGKRYGFHFIVSTNTISKDTVSERMLEIFETRILRGDLSDFGLKDNKTAEFISFPNRVETAIVTHCGDIKTVETEIVNRVERVEIIRDIKDKYPRSIISDKSQALGTDEMNKSSRFKKLIKKAFH